MIYYSHTILSKLSPAEFVKNAIYCFGPFLPKSTNEIEYYKAMTSVLRGHHYATNAHHKANKHHWQYWVYMAADGTDKCLDIPLRYKKEIIADWLAEFKVVDLMEWYWGDKTLLLHPDTQKWLEDELEKIESKYWQTAELPFD